MRVVHLSKLPTTFMEHHAADVHAFHFLQLCAECLQIVVCIYDVSSCASLNSVCVHWCVVCYRVYACVHVYSLVLRIGKS